MKTYNKECDELRDNGGILNDEDGIFYLKPGYISHRVDGPAMELHNGAKIWYYNGKRIMRTEGGVIPLQVIDFKLRIL